MDTIMARKTWRTLEPIHGLVYFAPEAHDAYRELGLDPTAGYFASRSAAMGPVGPEIVIATFYNFNPAIVRAAIPAAWDVVAPDVLARVRVDAAAAAIERVLGDSVDGPAMREAAELAERAAGETTTRTEGRPLFAAHLSLPWPDRPVERLWHAQMLLREFRGDGHVALLVTEGISGIEALVMHAATGAVTREGLQRTRAWDDEAWDAALAGLAERGLVDPTGAFTDAGRDLRDHIEHRTDALAAAPYGHLGEPSCQRLRELARPWSRAITAAMFS